MSLGKSLDELNIIQKLIQEDIKPEVLKTKTINNFTYVSINGFLCKIKNLRPVKEISSSKIYYTYAASQEITDGTDYLILCTKNDDYTLDRYYIIPCDFVRVDQEKPLRMFFPPNDDSAETYEYGIYENAWEFLKI